jgi:hypothetical protein
MQIMLPKKAKETTPKTIAPKNRNTKQRKQEQEE